MWLTVHPDALVGGRGHLEASRRVPHFAALLDAGHVPGPGVPVVAPARLDDGLGHEHVRRYVPPGREPVVNRDGFHDVAAAADRVSVPLDLLLAVAGAPRIRSGPRTPRLAASAGSVRESARNTIAKTEAG